MNLQATSSASLHKPWFSGLAQRLSKPISNPSKCLICFCFSAASFHWHQSPWSTQQKQSKCSARIVFNLSMPLLCSAMLCYALPERSCMQKDRKAAKGRISPVHWVPWLQKHRPSWQLLGANSWGVVMGATTFTPVLLTSHTIFSPKIKTSCICCQQQISSIWDSATSQNNTFQTWSAWEYGLVL